MKEFPTFLYTTTCKIPTLYPPGVGGGAKLRVVRAFEDECYYPQVTAQISFPFAQYFRRFLRTNCLSPKDRLLYGSVVSVRWSSEVLPVKQLNLIPPTHRKNNWLTTKALSVESTHFGK